MGVEDHLHAGLNLEAARGNGNPSHLTRRGIAAENLHPGGIQRVEVGMIGGIVGFQGKVDFDTIAGEGRLKGASEELVGPEGAAPRHGIPAEVAEKPGHAVLEGGGVDPARRVMGYGVVRGARSQVGPHCERARRVVTNGWRGGA